MGITKGQSGEYKETKGRADYYQLENNGGKLLLFKTGGQLVEQGLVYGRVGTSLLTRSRTASINSIPPEVSPAAEQGPL